jgi:DNA-directed RNA polymerase specialized sigma24 family protein
MGDDTTANDDLLMGRDAFMTRVEAVLDPSYRLATVMLLDRERAEDAVHEATLGAWRQYRRLRGNVTNFRTWFLSRVARECRRLRWRWRRPGGASGQELAPAGSAGEALVRLRRGSRAALFCFFYLDLPMDEVAHVLGVSTARARLRVHRAGERLDRPAEAEEP